MGAVVAVNSIGSALAPDGSLLGARWGLGDEFAGLPDPEPDLVAAHRAARAAEAEAVRAGTATTIAVVATDAALSKAGCQKLAGVAHDGMARALSPVHTPFDGDAVFALSTGDGRHRTGSTCSSSTTPPPAASPGPSRTPCSRPRRSTGRQTAAWSLSAGGMP